jgi:hypothetical protein
MTSEKIFGVGELVLVDVGSIEASFATYEPTNTPGTYFLYEKIDLGSFPSYNDFFGSKVRVKNGALGSIVKAIGAPRRMLSSRARKKYYVYEILTEGSVCQIFAKDLKPAIS